MNLLRIGRDPTQLLRSHRERVTAETTRLLNWNVVLVMVLPVVLITGVSLELSSLSPMYRGLFMTLALTLSLSYGPPLQFITLVHSEMYRLNLVIDDFIALLNTEPFEFKVCS